MATSGKEPVYIHSLYKKRRASEQWAGERQRDSFRAAAADSYPREAIYNGGLLAEAFSIIVRAAVDPTAERERHADPVSLGFFFLKGVEVVELWRFFFWMWGIGFELVERQRCDGEGD